MKQYPSCAILLTFLKKKKRVGDFYYYILGDSNSFQNRNYTKLIATCNSINKTYLNSHFGAESTIKNLFRAMLGDMCSGGLETKSGEDILYHLYLDWCSFIEKDWAKMYSEYKILMKKEYGIEKTI
jgi:hypothetical protein